MVAGKSAPRNPSQCEQRQQQADPEFRALQWRLPLEIIEVDALREFFSRACACHFFRRPNPNIAAPSPHERSQAKSMLAKAEYAVGATRATTGASAPDA